MSLVSPGPAHLDAVTRPAGIRPRTYARKTVNGNRAEIVSTVADDSQAWLIPLRHGGPVRDAAIADLHALLLRGAHHELARRRNMLTHIPREELSDLATEAADDALMAILAKLDSFRGASRFTTWAYKFVLLEAGVKARRRSWQGREVMLEDQSRPALADPAPTAQQTVEDSELLSAIRDAAASALTPHQREVFAALALNGVPIDVLAERLTTTRGALYKTLHDARRKLRRALAEAGHSLDDRAQTGGGP
jgi:RNA polymerase sigma-70 factor (ECF subfamily)